MKSCCLVLIAGNRDQSIEDRTDPSPDNLVKPRTALKCSAYQLEQLVGEQGDDPKHQMKPDFRSTSHHDVACPLGSSITWPEVETWRSVPGFQPGL